MVDWQSQDDPVTMAVSALVVVAAGAVFAWYGLRSAQEVTAVDAAVGFAAGVAAVSVQTWVAIQDAAGNSPVPRGKTVRFVVGAVVGVAGVAALDALPAMVAGFGVALIPLGLVSRAFLYRRTSRT